MASKVITFTESKVTSMLGCAPFTVHPSVLNLDLDLLFIGLKMLLLTDCKTFPFTVCGLRPCNRGDFF